MRCMLHVSKSGRWKSSGPTFSSSLHDNSCVVSVWHFIMMIRLSSKIIHIKVILYEFAA